MADFVVNLDGSIQDIRVVCENEALTKIVKEAIVKMPKWKPGTYKGYDVRAHYAFSSEIK
jgi:hypothetical protein